LTAFSFYAVYQHFGMSMELITALILMSLLVLSVLTDLRKQLILDSIILPCALFILISRLFNGEYSIWYYVSGLLVGFFLLWLLAVASKGGMGGGDVKLYAAIGLALGPWLTI